MEFSALYVSTRRLTAIVSNVLMIGLKFQIQIGQDQNLEKFSLSGIYLNHSLFLTLSNNCVVGLEG